MGTIEHDKRRRLKLRTLAFSSLTVILLMALLVWEMVANSDSEKNAAPEGVSRQLKAATTDPALTRTPPFPRLDRETFHYLRCSGSFDEHPPSVGVRYRSSDPLAWSALSDHYRAVLPQSRWTFEGKNAVGFLELYRKDFGDWSGRLSVFLSNDRRLLEVSIENINPVRCETKSARH
jgi:hypothetical protein